MKLAAASTSIPLPQVQLFMKAAAGINLNIPPTVRQLVRLLQDGANYLFVDPLSFYFFFNTLILLRELLQVMSN